MCIIDQNDLIYCNQLYCILLVDKEIYNILSQSIDNISSLDISYHKDSVSIAGPLSKISPIEQKLLNEKLPYSLVLDETQLVPAIRRTFNGKKLIEQPSIGPEKLICEFVI